MGCAQLALVSGASAVVGLVAAAAGQVQCLRAGPDVMVLEMNGVANYAASGGRDAFAVGATEANVGSVPLNYNGSTQAHPVLGLGLYRYREVDGAGRLEQVGVSWAWHTFFALSQGMGCSTCIPATGKLGVSCATPETASSMGLQSALGPRWQVNALTGAFAYPPANPGFSGPVARRLQAKVTELDAQSTYIVECHAVAADDAAAGNGLNNGSYRQGAMAGGPDEFSLMLTGEVVRERYAVEAWRAMDATVMMGDAIAAGEGRFRVASQATLLTSGLWRYEYAVYNINCDVAAGRFAVVVPENATVMNVGFHDVDHTDGDGVGNVSQDGTDWTWERVNGRLEWRTQPASVNLNANALRWGTMYNFRFDCDRAPGAGGAATIGLWKVAGEVAAGAKAPGLNCYANCDQSTTAPILNVADFGCFLTKFAAQDPYANCDQSVTPPVLNVADFACFIQAMAAGCPK